MSKELDDAYFRSTPCTHHEPLLSKLVDCVDLLEERIKGLLGATVSVGETETLPAGSEATAKASKRGYDTVLDFGIPCGEPGEPGAPGAPGEPGAPGAPGEPGADGYSPTANVVKNGGTATITVTDKNGTTTATVSDGAPGSDAAATDVRINGTSITADGVADIPMADNRTLGVVAIRTDGTYGLAIGEGNNLFITKAQHSAIDARNSDYKPIVSKEIDYAVKAAMCDGKGAAWTAEEQAAAKRRMGITEGGSAGSRFWFSIAEPQEDIETYGYFGFNLSDLVCSESVNPNYNMQNGDTILWNGYAYFVEGTDSGKAMGSTKYEFAPHKA